MSQSPVKQDRGTPPPMPNWAKVFGAILIVLILAVIVLHVTGNSLGGLHHMP